MEDVAEAAMEVEGAPLEQAQLPVEQEQTDGGGEPAAVGGEPAAVDSEQLPDSTGAAGPEPASLGEPPQLEQQQLEQQQLEQQQPAAGDEQPPAAASAALQQPAPVRPPLGPSGGSGAAPGYEPAPSRSKKKRGGAAQRSGSEPPDLVQLSGPISPSSERLRHGWQPVRLSEEEKAAQIELDGARLQARSQKGYRTVRATHGAHEGTWYYEVTIEDLGEKGASTGATRIGWATARAELQAPVGYDTWGYSYRSKEGSKVHAGWRDQFGEPYQAGDVVGCLLHLPPGGQPLLTLRERPPEEVVVRHKKKLYYQESDSEERREPEVTPVPLEGAFVAFTKNGVLQGKAYEGIREGTYYPALSLYSDASKYDDCAAVRCNFGEAPFAHPPPQFEGVAETRPVAEMAGPKPEGWTEGMLKREEGEEDE